MKQVKNIIFIVIATVFAGLFFSANASAAATEINTMEDFAVIMTNGGEAVLGNDITLDGNRAISNPLTLDLNGHTLNTVDKTILLRSDLTIKDSVGGGMISGTGTENYVFQVGGITNPSTGTITLESGLITSSSYGISVLSGELTVNGGKIFASDYAIQSWGKVTINGGEIEATTADGRSTVHNSGDGSQFEMNGGTIIAHNNGVGLQNSFDQDTEVGSTAVINGGEISAIETGGDAVTAYKNCTVTVNGGKLISDSAALISNGSESGKSTGRNAKFIITGGELISDRTAAIYAPQVNGETNISGGTLRGRDSAIEIRAGALNITGGTLIAEYPSFEVVLNSNGTTTKGAAVAVAQHNTKQPIVTHICGGTFRATVPVSVANPQGNADEYVALVDANIDEPCGELIFESTGDSSLYAEQNMLKTVRGGIYTYSVADFLEETYGERMTDDGRYEVLPVYTLRTRTTYGGGVAVSKRKAFAGDTIDVETDADLAFELKTLSATGNSTGAQAQIQNDTFTMPAENVTVAASFGFIPSPEPQPENLPDPTPGPASIPEEQQGIQPVAIVTEEKKDAPEPITPEKKDDGITPPNTGDDLGLYVVTLIVSGFGLLTVVPKPRKN